MEGHPKKALTSQIAREKGNSLAMEVVVDEMRKALKTMEENVGVMVYKARKEARRAAKVATEQLASAMVHIANM